MSGLTELLDAIKTQSQRLYLHAGRPCRVLVVDDDESVRQLADRVLTEAGYVTVLAANGFDALSKFETNGPFDVLLTDFSLPQMNGAELARRIRSAQPSVKVLYVTGCSDALFASKTRLWSDEAFLEKPCAPDSLLQAVSLLLYGHVSPQKTVWS